jgi:hypothetical protein
VKDLFSFIWESSPWWIKYPMIILGTPTALTLAFLSWHTSSIHAVIRPYREVRDAEMKVMYEKLNTLDHKFNSINEKSNSMDRKLDILILRTK